MENKKKSVKTTSGKIKTDWEALKREFFADTDFFNISTFLREKKGWDSKKVSNGNTLTHIDGWGKEKANLQQKITDDEIEAIRREERKRYPKLLKNKMNLIVELTKRIEGHQMEVGRGKNKKVLTIPESIKGLEAIWKIIKIEMGEPIIIQKNENENKDAQEVEELRQKLDEAIKNANEVE